MRWAAHVALRRSYRYDHGAVSPTIFREGPYRFFFFSREESRLHVHVASADGEVKFRLSPQIELAET